MEENKISLCLRFKRNFSPEYHHPKTKIEFELYFYLSTFNFQRSIKFSFNFYDFPFTYRVFIFIPHLSNFQSSFTLLLANLILIYTRKLHV